MVNHLVLNLKSYSHRDNGLDTSRDCPHSELKFARNRVLGNIGSPLVFDQDINSLIENDILATERDVGGPLHGLDTPVVSRMVQRLYFFDSELDLLQEQRPECHEEIEDVVRTVQMEASRALVASH